MAVNILGTGYLLSISHDIVVSPICDDHGPPRQPIAICISRYLFLFHSNGAISPVLVQYSQSPPACLTHVWGMVLFWATSRARNFSLFVLVCGAHPKAFIIITFVTKCMRPFQRRYRLLSVGTSQCVGCQNRVVAVCGCGQVAAQSPVRSHVTWQ